MKIFNKGNKGNKGCREHLPLKVIRSQLKNNFGADGHLSEPPLANVRDSLSSHLDEAPVHDHTTQNLGLGAGRLNVLQVLLSDLRMERRNTSTAQRRLAGVAGHAHGPCPRGAQGDSLPAGWGWTAWVWGTEGSFLHMAPSG